MSRAHAIAIANRHLANPHDETGDMAVLSRQFLEACRVIDKQEAAIKDFYKNEYDPMADVIQSNRDAILKIHEEAASRIRKCLKRGDLTMAQDVLDALSLFHPMHCESWRGWPEGSDK